MAAHEKDRDDVVDVVGRVQKGAPDQPGDATKVNTIMDRPNDTPIAERVPAVMGSTFAERTKARVAAEKRQSDQAKKAEKK